MSGAEGDLRRNLGVGVSIHSECLDMLASTQSKHYGSDSSGLYSQDGIVYDWIVGDFVEKSNLRSHRAIDPQAST